MVCHRASSLAPACPLVHSAVMDVCAVWFLALSISSIPNFNSIFMPDVRLEFDILFTQFGSAEECSSAEDLNPIFQFLPPTLTHCHFVSKVLACGMLT